MELIVISDGPDCLSLAVKGNISQMGLQGEREPLAREFGAGVYQRAILLSLGNADYMDSSGVSWLLGCHKKCREAGGCLVIHSVPPLIAQILKVLHMELVLNLAPSEAEARERLRSEARS